jgi:hypothetical protein
LRPGKVLADYSGTRDGKIWLRFDLSASMIATGNCSILSSMKNMIIGELTLKTEDGTEVGRFPAKDGRGWGLARLLQRSGGEPGESLFLTFDLQAKDAFMNFFDQSDSRFLSPPWYRAD